MDDRRKRPVKRVRYRLTAALLLTVIFLSACGRGHYTPDDDENRLPVMAVLPFFVKGNNLQGMMDATEKMIFYIVNSKKFRPLDTGESIRLVKKYHIHGIYPPANVFEEIGKKEKVDLILIGKIIAEKKVSGEFDITGVETIEVNVRSINARNGKLRQVIIRSMAVEESANATVDALLESIVENLE